MDKKLKRVYAADSTPGTVRDLAKELVQKASKTEEEILADVLAECREVDQARPSRPTAFDSNFSSNYYARTGITAPPNMTGYPHSHFPPPMGIDRDAIEYD